MTNVIAIALFGSRVSPRFDCAACFRIVTINDGELSSNKVISMENYGVIDRIKTLGEFNVETLICGGIDRFAVRQLELNDINVYSWITGEADDALSCYLEGKLESGFMMAPGGSCCGRWHFRCGNGGGQRRERRRRGLPPES